MFTPQEIQEQTFSKAVFGGYDMQQVDDFLEPLTEDYIMLYKENSVLKSKMKVLVEKLEEYRGQEAAMKQQMAQAQLSANAQSALGQRGGATIGSLFDNLSQAYLTRQIMNAAQNGYNLYNNNYGNLSTNKSYGGTSS